MALENSLDGHGTTITFGTSGFSANVLDVDWSGATRESMDDTYMSTEEAKEFLPANLYDPGELTVKIKHGTSTASVPPVFTDPPVNEEITIQWGSSGKTYTMNGHATSYSASAAIGQRMEGELKVKLSGAITIS